MFLFSGTPDARLGGHPQLNAWVCTQQCQLERMLKEVPFCPTPGGPVRRPVAVLEIVEEITVWYVDLILDEHVRWGDIFSLEYLLVGTCFACYLFTPTYVPRVVSLNK